MEVLLVKYIRISILDNPCSKKSFFFNHYMLIHFQSVDWALEFETSKLKQSTFRKLWMLSPLKQPLFLKSLIYPSCFFFLALVGYWELDAIYSKIDWSLVVYTIYSSWGVVYTFSKLCCLFNFYCNGFVVVSASATVNVNVQSVITQLIWI